MSVFYKFKSAKDYDTISFEGSHISLGRLKQSIVAQKKLPKSQDYDLLLENAQNGEVYKYDSDLVPKNTSVLVKRVPVARGVGGSSNTNNTTTTVTNTVTTTPAGQTNIPTGNTANAQKSLTGSLWSRNKSNSNDNAPSFGSVFSSTNPNPYSSVMNTIQPSLITNNTINSIIPGTLVNSTSNVAGNEQDKLQAILQGADKWIPETSNQQQHSTGKKIPPPNYICHRCKRPGHYIQHCPTNGDPRYNIKTIRKATGIPKSFLKPIEAPKGDLNNTLVMPGGGLAVLETNEKEFNRVLGGKKKGTTVDSEQKDIPKEFQCPICSKLMIDAVSMPCCKTNYCNSCIANVLIHDTDLVCPNCQAPNQIIDNLIPNYELRERIARFKNTLDLAKKTVTTTIGNNNITTQSVQQRKTEEKRDENKQSFLQSSNSANDNRSMNSNKQTTSRSPPRDSRDHHRGHSGRDNRNQDRRGEKRRDYVSYHHENDRKKIKD
ncbi:hypothetical protein ABK040_006315 [Willaertia magna]